MPSAGYCILVAYYIISVGKKWGGMWLILIVSGLLSASFALVTISGQEVWKNHVLLWKTATIQNPNEFAPRLNYANALRDEGRVDEAIQQYQIALSSDIRASKVWKSKAAHGLAVTYYDKGDFKNSEKLFKIALDYDKEYIDQYYYYVGVIKMKENDLSTAQNYLEKYLEFESSNAEAYFALGLVYIKEAVRENSVVKLQLAEEALKSSIAIKPKVPRVHLNLEQVYRALGENQKAREQAKIVLDTSKNQSELKQAESILGLN